MHQLACAVESLALLLHSTRNRTLAPAHRLSSISLTRTYCANLKLKTKHTLAVRWKRFRIENILCSFERVPGQLSIGVVHEPD
jgi:hypothetical protein